MSPASSDLEIDRVESAPWHAPGRRRRRLVLRWRIEALAYLLVLLVFGAIPLLLSQLSETGSLVDRLPFPVLEAVALGLGVVTAELLRAGQRGIRGDDGEGDPPPLPFSRDSGGAQAESAGDSIHEHGSSSQTLDTYRRPPRERIARGSRHE